jgi:hypothetical protein
VLSIGGILIIINMYMSDMSATYHDSDQRIQWQTGKRDAQGFSATYGHTTRYNSKKIKYFDVDRSK